jgi:heat-inducible transcriptional repressor
MPSRTPTQSSQDKDVIAGRKKDVLKAVVETYVKDAVPVSSKKIAEKSFSGVSSATIRNDLAVLEETGYLSHTHVSSGRIPTDKGYRFFVDNFVDDSHRDSKIQLSVLPIEPHLENVLEKTVQLISAHTKLTAVAVGSSAKSRIISDLHLSHLDDSRYVLAVVFNDASIDSIVFTKAELGNSVNSENLEIFLKHFAVSIKNIDVTKISGISFDDTFFQSAENKSFMSFFQKLLKNGLKSADKETNVFLSGTSMIAQNYAGPKNEYDSEISTHLLTLIEQHMQLAQIVEQSLLRSVSARIGSENVVEEMAHHSMVLAPVNISDVNSAALGIIGPTRMDYQQIFGCLSFASELVESKMEKMDK